MAVCLKLFLFLIFNISDLLSVFEVSDKTKLVTAHDIYRFGGGDRNNNDFESTEIPQSGYFDWKKYGWSPKSAPHYNYRKHDSYESSKEPNSEYYDWKKNGWLPKNTGITSYTSYYNYSGKKHQSDKNQNNYNHNGYGHLIGEKNQYVFTTTQGPYFEKPEKRPTNSPPSVTPVYNHHKTNKTSPNSQTNHHSNMTDKPLKVGQTQNINSGDKTVDTDNNSDFKLDVRFGDH